MATHLFGVAYSFRFRLALGCLVSAGEKRVMGRARKLYTPHLHLQDYLTLFRLSSLFCKVSLPVE